MHQSKILGFTVFLSLIIIYFEFSSQSPNQLSDINRTLPTLDKISFIESPNLVMNQAYNTVWGISEPNKETENNATKPKPATINNKELCIQKSCYKLLGIIQHNNTNKVSFFNKNLKPSIQSFTLGEIIAEQIVINSITPHSIELKTTTGEYLGDLKMFDINTTKYKPKERE